MLGFYNIFTKKTIKLHALHFTNVLYKGSQRLELSRYKVPEGGCPDFNASHPKGNLKELERAYNLNKALPIKL